MRKIHKDSKKELKFEKENLPKGWIKTKLENICIIIGGGTPSRQKIEYFNGDIIWLTPTEIPKYQIIRINDSREKITELGLKKSSAKIIPINSVLLTSRASIGYVAIAGTEVTTNQGFASFVCNKTTSSYFLAYWLFGNKNLLESKATGTTFKEISKSKLRELEFKLPPLNEQKRIVSKIESILVQIDAGREKLESVKVLLKQAKQSISKLELLKLTKKCNLQSLENICTKITDGSHNSPSNSLAGEVPYVTVKNIRPKKLDFTNITYITKKDHKEIFARCNPEKGDVLYTKDGTVGYAVVNEYDFEFSLLSSVALLKPDHKIVDSYYLENILNNSIMYNSVIKKMSGTALRRIILKRIKEIQIPIPPLSEQKRIVSKIESIFGRIDAYRIVINSKTRQKLVTMIINSI